jgi:hypothetical protein
MKQAKMRATSLTLGLASAVMAAPMAQLPAGGAVPAAPAGGFDFGALLGGFDLGALLGGTPGSTNGLDLGALLNSFGSLFGSGGPDTSTPVIIQGYGDVKKEASALDAAITAIPATGDASAAIKDVLAKAKIAEAALKSSAEKISKIPNVDLFASMGLSAPGGEVTAVVAKIVDNLTSKKDIIVKANQKAPILAALKDLKAATESFTSAINGKLPMISSDAGKYEGQKSIDAWDKLAAVFA